MKFIVIALCVVIVAIGVKAQYPECHYECELISCDYYSDYCEYDCGEICYFTQGSSKSDLSTMFLTKAAIKGQEWDSQLPIDLSSLKGGLNQFGRNVEQEARKKTRTGKVVRMKIANPTFQRIRNGQTEITRGLPSRGFALYQSCFAKDKL